MALHQITERHKVNILGQEITYTNKFIRHTEGTSLHFKVSNSLISHASNLFKYRYEHDLLGPTLFVSSQTGKKYIMPTGQEVHPETTLKDIEWIKPVLKSIEKEKTVEKENWMFESSSEKGIFYKVTKKGDKITCNCSGFWRSKIRKCKHVLQVEKELSNDSK
jgi:hypothetical protein